MSVVSNAPGFERALLASHAALGDGIAVLDGERVRFLNHALSELCGAPMRALSTRAALVEKLDPGQRARLARLLAEPGPEPQRFAAVLVRGDGRRSAVELDIVAVEIDGRSYCCLRVRRRDARAKNPISDDWRLHAFVSEASELMSSTLDQERCLEALAQLAVPRFADWCMIELVEEDGLRLMASAHREREDAAWLAEELRRFRPRDEESPFGVCSVLSTGKAALIADVEDAITDPRTSDPEDLRIYHALGVRSAILAPMLAGGRVVGLLRFFGGSKRAAFSRRDVEAASELGRRVGMAIEHARLSRASANALRMRDELLVTTSHELRTPLTALLLHMQSLELALGQVGELDRESLHARASKAVQQTRRLASLVNELLDVSRLCSGKVWLNLEEAELGELVQVVMERYRDRAERAGCELKLRTIGLVRGRWDRTRVEQIVENLLSNAIKFAPQRPIDIRVAFDETHAELSVRDGGPGIAPADRQRIFQRFEQLDHPNQDGSGLGLGLFLARELSQAHGGNVCVESGPGQGATFTVRLPLDRG